MSTISKFKTLSKAKENFSKAKYKEAMQQFGVVLQSFPNSKEAYNGVILSEMAMSGEGGAEALFDYYEILQEENSESADTIMSDILQNMDSSIESISEVLSEPLKNRLDYEDGILYEDFRKLLSDGGEFKEIFENIMFSTKVIITQKEDFLNFLDSLIENNFTDMALTYLESAINVYPNDKKLTILLEKLVAKGDTVED